MSIQSVEIKTEPGVILLETESFEEEKYEAATLHSEFDIKIEENSSDFSSVKEEKHSDVDMYGVQPIFVDSIKWHKPNKESLPSTVACKEEPIETPNSYAQRVEVINTPTGEQENMSDLKHNQEEALTLDCPSNGKYMCPMPQCQSRFSYKGHMLRHMLQHNGENLKCKICYCEFGQTGQLMKHLTVHLEEKRFKCDQCDKTFKTTSNLQQHKRVHMTVKPFVCERCHRRFTVKANLLRHQSKSRCKRPIDEPIVCNICNKEFDREFLLRSHLTKHTTERPYCCDICKMNFKHKSTLVRHIQLHNGSKPYACNVCKKKFTHPGLMKPHMRVHTGEKPYPCSVCSKLFAHKFNMQRHARRHEKVKRLVCDVCNKKFRKESHLKYHMRIHTKDKPFKCGVCVKTFSHKQNVLKHYTRKHPHDTYSCPDTEASVARAFWESVMNKNIKLEPGNGSSVNFIES